MKSNRADNVTGNCSSDIGIGDRWAALLRDQVYRGPNKAKRIQQDWGISLSMAYVWLSGGKPTTDQIAAAREKWGDIVIQFLFGRMPIKSVDERLAAVEQQIAALKGGTENGIGQDHRGADAALPHLASGGQRAQGRMVEGDQGSSIERRLLLAQEVEARRRFGWGR